MLKQGLSEIEYPSNHPDKQMIEILTSIINDWHENTELPIQFLNDIRADYISQHNTNGLHHQLKGYFKGL